MTFGLLGLGMGVAAADTPLTIHGANLLAWWRPGVGVTYAVPAFTATNDWSNAAWTKTAMTAAANVITESAGTSLHCVRQTPDVGAGMTVTYGVDIGDGPGVGSKDFSYLEGNGGTSRVHFNHNTGAVISETNGTGTITSLGGGQWRITMTFTRTSGECRIGFTSDGTDGTLSYAGNPLFDYSIANATVTQANSVGTWDDQSGNAKHLTQALAAKAPLYAATGGANSVPCMTFDGAGDILTCAGLNLPAPGTTPSYIVLIVKQLTWAGNGALLGGGSAYGCNIRQGGTEPELQQLHDADANHNTALAMNTWGRLATLFSGSTSDFVKLIATEVSGDNAGGGSDPNGFSIGGGNALFTSNIVVSEAWVVSGTPSGGSRTSEDSYITSVYGSGLV